MNNPFEIIDARLGNIENLLLDIYKKNEIISEDFNKFPNKELDVLTFYRQQSNIPPKDNVDIIIKLISHFKNHEETSLQTSFNLPTEQEIIEINILFDLINFFISQNIPEKKGLKMILGKINNYLAFIVTGSSGIADPLFTETYTTKKTDTNLSNIFPVPGGSKSKKRRKRSRKRKRKYTSFRRKHTAHRK